ncbi:MAG: Xaa-Pro peptidase family protein [Eubacteriales bacterium]|nr:Xaa-Pro peptidase family protein [Eubacteriales bacterium]
MLTKKELKRRLDALMSALGSGWDTAFIINRVNQYYLTGTMQDGLLVIKKDGKMSFFVRRSFERAKAESPLENIHPMGSYRDVAGALGGECGTVYLDIETVTVGVLNRLKKYFKMDEILPIDNILLQVRAVKSSYELSIMQETGRLHHEFLTKEVPKLLYEGMTEADFTGAAYQKLLSMGHHGVARFNMFQVEAVCGQVGFGTNSLYPTNFDGPGGMLGASAAAPVIGNRNTTLKKGDLVFVDFAFGIDGYHTDKTAIYSFGAPPAKEVQAAHKKCMEIQNSIAKQLKPGNIPSEIYTNIMESLDDDFKENFMGFEDRRVSFLGHGIGLHIDEAPVIAKGFKAPLQENMVIAIEPKKGMAGFGLVGAEDTYVVEKDGGRCITGSPCDIIVV